MSRTTTNEYIGAKRRAYAEADRAKRTRILDEVCETTGYERKYANRLPTGSRKKARKQYAPNMSSAKNGLSHIQDLTHWIDSGTG